MLISQRGARRGWKIEDDTAERIARCRTDVLERTVYRRLGQPFNVASDGAEPFR